MHLAQIQSLVKAASELDNRGFHKEADSVDKVMVSTAQDSGVSVARALHFIEEAIKRNKESEFFLSSVRNVLLTIREGQG
jgi:hypothetical protein